MKVIYLGYDNYVLAEKIIAITPPDSAPAKRLVSNLKGDVELIDATSGRKTRSIIFLDNKQILLSSMKPDTIIKKLSEEI